MKTAFIISLLFLTASKMYEYRPLEWSDFKGEPGKQIAHLESEISVSWENVKGKDDSLFNFEVWPTFLPHESYTRTSDLYILSHENLHWDITKIYAHKLEKQLKSVISCNNALYEAVKKTTIDEWTAEEERYDLETAHSQNHTAQVQWQERINREMK